MLGPETRGKSWTMWRSIVAGHVVARTQKISREEARDRAYQTHFFSELPYALLLPVLSPKISAPFKIVTKASIPIPRVTFHNEHLTRSYKGCL